jgi:hypothetical protein
MVNHLFAVGVLRWIILPQRFINNPTIATTLCNAVRKHFFDGDSNMMNERIWKGTELASAWLGLDMLAGEHALYEAVHKSKGNDAGKDAFYEGQDLVWVEDTLDNNKII